MELFPATVAGWKWPEAPRPAASTSRHVVSRPYDEVAVQRAQHEYVEISGSSDRVRGCSIRVTPKKIFH
jgi:hypothetical protein